MKVGLSLSRCVKDIVEGNVHIDDILVLITRTDFDPTVDQEWTNIWNGYTGYSSRSRPDWIGLDQDVVRAVVIDLWQKGLIHQPRKFGAYPSRRPNYWLETILVEEDIDKNPILKDTWNQFQMLAGLTNVSIDKDYG